MNDAIKQFAGRRADGLGPVHQAGGRPLQVELERLPGVLQLHVAVGDVLHHAAAAGLGLEADGRPVAGVGHAVPHLDVADSAGGFAAHRHAAVPVVEAAVLDDDVFGEPVDAQPVGVLAALNGDAVVVDIDRKSTRLNSSHLGISYAV